MKVFYRIALFVFIAAFLGCQSQPSLTDKQKEEVKKEVAQQFDVLASAIRHIDAKAWSQNYSSDEFISAVVITDYFADRKAWVDTISGYFSKRDMQVIEPVEMKVTPLAPDLALMVSKENVGLKLKGGKDTKFHHVFTMLWKKEKDGWRILHSHESVAAMPDK